MSYRQPDSRQYGDETLTASLGLPVEINLALRPSRQLQAFVLLTHCVAGVVVWWSRLALPLCLLLDFIIAASLLLTWRRHCSFRERFLSFRAGQWRLRDEAGEESLRLEGESVLSPRLLVLAFRSAAGRRKRLILPSDAAPAQDLRRLRVLLRCGSPRTLYPQSGPEGVQA